MGKKLDDSAIEWSSGTNDTWFDQSMLAAKKEMCRGLKADILDRIMVVKSREGGQRKRKNRKVKTKKESNPVKQSGVE